MRKKLLLVCALIAIMCCLFAIGANAAEPSVTFNGVTYQFGNVVTVEGVTAPEGYDTESRILMSDGKTYPAFYFVGAKTEIASGSFVWTNATKTDGSAYSFADIVMLEIPSNIVRMKNDAPLAEADNMVYVSMPSITTWNNESHLSDLASLVVLDLSRATKTTYIPRGFAMKNPNLTTIIWPSESSIKEIGRGAFTGCTSLTSVELPKGLTKLGEDNHNNPGVFENCTNLVSVELPDSLTHIGKKDFLNCSSLLSIDIPRSVTRICREAFQNCSSLTSVTFRDVGETNSSHIYVGHTNFAGCDALASITFPQDTVTVDGGAFSGRKNTEINIKALFGTVGDGAFKNCANLNIEDFSQITKVNKEAFYNCTGLTEIDLSSVTSVGQYAFQNCTGLVNVKFDAFLTNIGAEAFRDCTSLVFVDFGDCVSLEIPNHRTFYNCKSLLAISLPSGITNLNNGTFGKCHSLQAVYLGESMVEINGNKGDGAGDGPTFAECANMYFVQEPFSVVKEDGTFYTKEEFAMPVKEAVYFFPSTLVTICGSHNTSASYTVDENGHVTNTGADDLAFVGCTNLNSYLVFPEGFTGVDNGTRSDDNKDAYCNEDQRGDTLSRGLFHNCGTESNPLTLVFLGRIDRLSFDRRYGYTNYMTYVFANPENTGFENTVIGSYIGDGGNYGGQKEMYVVFCHAEDGAKRYGINFAPTEGNTTTPILNYTLIEGGATHIENPRIPAQVVGATCTDNETRYVYCFCGMPAGSVETENTALGHSHTKYIGMVYENFMAEGYNGYKCERCEDIDSTEVLAPLFEDKGYSACTFGDGYSITQGFYVNVAAINAYKSYAADFDFGILATVNKEVDDNGNAVAIAPKLDDENVLTGNFVKDKHEYLDIKATGITEERKDIKIVFCVYVTVGDTMYYLDNGATGESIVGISYNEILELNKSEVTE